MKKLLSLIAIVCCASTVNAAPYLLELNAVVTSFGGDDAASRVTIGETVSYTVLFDLDHPGEARKDDQIEYRYDQYYAELIDGPSYNLNEMNYDWIDDFYFLGEVNENRSVFEIGNYLTLFIYDWVPTELPNATPGMLEDITYGFGSWQVDGNRNHIRLDEFELVSVTEVPVPPAFLLFGTALVGLAGFERKK
ncbi:hypothetical protein [Oceanicoccus sp. KOV_DT_Chl]|uniref:hypothetical protein n=1 Tax=Oceanicoccus sp. KOV_DT_Chl TaxID=1904639 RepID=UPI000C7AB6CB|nr:hypothetical protein [Oceanicoccus sp. KOV_DT_Chl]